MAIDGRNFNPRKKAAFTVEINGIETALVYKVKLPVAEVPVDEFAGGGATRKLKTAGIVKKFDDLELTKVIRADAADDTGWQMLITVVDEGAPPADYKFDCTVTERDRDGSIIAVNRFLGAFCYKREREELDSSGDDAANSVEKLYLKVDDYILE